MNVKGSVSGALTEVNLKETLEHEVLLVFLVLPKYTLELVDKIILHN